MKMKIIFLSIFAICTSAEAATVAGCRVLQRLEQHGGLDFLASQRKLSPTIGIFEKQGYVWALAASQDFKKLEMLPFDATQFLDTPSPASGLSPLGLAALCHDSVAISELIAAGAQINKGAGSIETPWGILDNPTPIELAIIGKDFEAPSSTNSIAMSLDSTKKMINIAIARIKASLPGISISTKKQ